MIKWEYLFVTAELFDYRFRPRFVNDAEARDWFDGPPVSRYANQLGRQGWELVSVSHGTAMQLVFKRSIGASTDGATDRTSPQLD